MDEWARQLQKDNHLENQTSTKYTIQCIVVFEFPALSSKDTLIFEKHRSLEIQNRQISLLNLMQRHKQANFWLEFQELIEIWLESKLQKKMPLWIYKQLEECPNFINETQFEISLKLYQKQQFRHIQLQNVLNKLFQQSRMPSLLVFKVEELDQLLTQNPTILQNTKQYLAIWLVQGTIKQIIMIGRNAYLSQLYQLMIWNFVNTLQYQIDVGYYVLSVLVYFMCYFDSLNGNGLKAYAVALYFLELFLNQLLNQKYGKRDHFLEALKIAAIYQSKLCDFLIQLSKFAYRTKLGIFSPDLSISIILPNWQHFKDVYTIIVWDEIFRQLMNLNNEEICVFISKFIVQIPQSLQI
ncbi:unnamed protein product [Paramecium octaurelia]|uniref:Uncharacterized protein n=1 Tax=Paramecium octaurelia TaxID=43137 RepID=A0A8S1YJC9_PAROT|nr:unnamed protein product [Paramecium octaurelia]